MAAPSGPRNPVYLTEEASGPYDHWYPLTAVSPEVVWYRGKKYPSAEHLFQAMKFENIDPALSEAIRIAPTPSDARELANANEHPGVLQADFYTGSGQGYPPAVLNMRQAMYLKFAQYEGIKWRLEQTGSADIYLLSSDGYWGKRPAPIGNQDQNWFGRLLMELRSTLKAQEDGKAWTIGVTRR
ncbi:hypothetical protein CALVIDRAFT_596376 [Calocera viscosa TUFC12733]|uniref:NADAR domain-containing protein n=1 Tax=Calocera viscosa (strain TUFC12733) TaxID=1330018 RepID=A0A167PFT4_CALVF|nr:hypothetical protein CALVIDRAFT_596376 [Calocera viscosa TUFC12733]